MSRFMDRGPLPQDKQTGLPGEIYAQPEHVAGSLALKPGLRVSPDPVSEPHAIDDERSGGLGPKRGRWFNPYHAVVMPFTISLESERIISGNVHRAYVLIQNLDATEDMWVNFGNPAVAGSSVLLIPLGNYEFIGGAMGGPFSPADSVHVVGTTAEQRGVIVQGVPWWSD